MIQLKDEVCVNLIKKEDHMLYQMAGSDIKDYIGNLLDPCPLTVFL